MSPQRTFTAVPGFFAQDEPTAIASVIGSLPPRFGLLDSSPGHWDTFKAKIAELNRDAVGGEKYKVMWLGRHGQGYHNVAEAKYGVKAWDDYWAMVNGDGELTWGPDPKLTPLGEMQALDAHKAWLMEVAAGIPTPEKCYCSPLKRALDTWTGTFQCKEDEPQILVDSTVLVLENCREEYGEHACDLRSPLSELRTLYPPPTYKFEEGFAETDPLWTAHERETVEQCIARARKVLDVIFDGPETYVSITAHGGIINGLLNAMGRPRYALPTGGIIPVVVKASRAS